MFVCSSYELYSLRAFFSVQIHTSTKNPSVENWFVVSFFLLVWRCDQVKLITSLSLINSCILNADFLGHARPPPPQILMPYEYPIKS